MKVILASKSPRRKEIFGAYAEECGFSTAGLIQSPIEGGDGNVEFLAHFRRRGNE